MELESNFFKLFDIPQQFFVNERELKKRSRELLRRCHPDLYVNASAQERRLAVQYSAQVNQGYEVLLDPIKRAQHLMSLAGIATDEQRTVGDTGFLIEQMALREALEEARDADDLAALAELKQRVEQSFIASQQSFAEAESSDTQLFAIAKMQFFDKLKRELANAA